MPQPSSFIPDSPTPTPAAAPSSFIPDRQPDFRVHVRASDQEPGPLGLAWETAKGYASEFNPFALVDHLYDRQKGAAKGVVEAFKAGDYGTALDELTRLTPTAIVGRLSRDVVLGQLDQLRR